MTIGTWQGLGLHLKILPICNVGLGLGLAVYNTTYTIAVAVYVSGIETGILREVVVRVVPSAVTNVSSAVNPRLILSESFVVPGYTFVPGLYDVQATGKGKGLGLKLGDRDRGSLKNGF